MSKAKPFLSSRTVLLNLAIVLMVIIVGGIQYATDAQIVPQWLEPYLAEAVVAAVAVLNILQRLRTDTPIINPFVRRRKDT